MLLRSNLRTQSEKWMLSGELVEWLGRRGGSVLQSYGERRSGMSRWAKPEYSKKQVNAAGKTLVNPDASAVELSDALEVINNFRSIHGHPLNTFQTTLRIKGRHVDKNIIVAQRVKRLSSIELKLSRFPTMTLSQMQDIGGCRVLLAL